MDNNRISHILNFIDDVVCEGAKQQTAEINFVMELAADVRRCIEQNRHLVPYHLNLIDELHINENGHSRILYKLLEYRNPDGDYIFLKSLLKYISKNCEAFEKICVTNPEITQEQCRIDLWVRDRAGRYAIIFENKVYNATDQEAQIARYIECTQSNGYPLDKIFVVYMPQKDDKDPVDDSWGKYKEAFASRYVKFSFRNGVLPWLKSEVLPSIPDKDKLLKSAIEQYVDYLEGLFKQRESDKQLYIMIENYIKEKLGLNDDPFVNKQELERKIEELDEVRQYLVNMIDDYKTQIFEQWKQHFNRCFPQYRCELTNDFTLLMKLPICGRIVYAELTTDTNGLYWGLSDKEGLKDIAVLELLTPIMENLRFDIKSDLAKDKKWYGWKYVEWNKACDVGSILIDNIKNI